MAHSICVLYLHLVFSTKDRIPFIEPAWQNDLYAYIGGIIKNLHGEPILINGTADHIHILCSQPKETAVAPFLRDIKANSSRWASQSHSPKFQWQDGYGSFSVGVSSLDQVKGYIRNQAEHHQKRDFSAEYDALLRACGIVPLGELG